MGIAILYNVVLNIKQTQTESELENLKMTLDSHKELFDNVSKDLIVISEKIKIVELDLEDVKASSKDIEELKEINQKLLDYASNLNQTERTGLREETRALFLSSGGGSFRLKPLLIVAILMIPKKCFI